MKFISLLLLLLIHLSAAPRYKAQNPEIEYDTSIGLGYYTYKEPGVMDISGPVIEFKGNAVSYFDNTGAEAFVSVASGVLTKYDGSFSDGTPLKANSIDFFGSLGFRIGADIASLLETKELKGLLYTGFGGRYLYNKISGSGSYTRMQTYLYIPAGFTMTHNIGFRYGIEGRWLARGYNFSYLSQVNSRFSDLSFTQKNGYGGSAYLGYEYTLLSKKVFTQVATDYWEIGKSDIQCTGGSCFIEPKNRTIMGTLEFGMKF